MDTTSGTTSYLSTIGFSLLAVLVITLTAAYYFIEMSRKVRLIKKLPNPPSIPIIGHALIALGQNPNNMMKIALKYREMYGPVVSIYAGPKTLIFLTDPHDIEIILSSSVHIDKSEEYRFFQPWFGDGLLISTGDKWRRDRKAIAPTFHMNILKTFVPLFYENSIDLVRRLRDKLGKEFDCHDYLTAAMVDILTETAMGVRQKRGQKPGFDYASAVMKLSDILHRRHYDMFLRPDFLFQFTKHAKRHKKLLNIVQTTANRVIQEKTKQQTNVQNDMLTESSDAVENAENVKSNSTNDAKLHYVRDDLDDNDENDVGEKKRLAFLEMMLDMKRNGGQMTDEDIKDQVNTIMFEGHDTTGAGSSFTLCLLGCHPDIQARVYEELNEIFGDSDRQCTFQDTLKMKYLERVILESLRLFPPVPLIARQLNEDVKIVTGNYILPKNCTIVIAQYAIHREEKYYPNPSVFNPDNFLPERMQQRHYYAYIPFSAGPRSCVGRKFAMLKLKVLLSTILRNYRVISDCSDKDFKLRADIILKREDGFKIKIEPRKSACE